MEQVAMGAAIVLILALALLTLAATFAGLMLLYRGWRR